VTARATGIGAKAQVATSMPIHGWRERRTSDYRACRTSGQAPHGYPRRVAGVGDAVGPYRIQAILGEGGMGQVFRAAHAQTGALVALKLLRPEVASDEGLIRRLLREASAR